MFKNNDSEKNELPTKFKLKKARKQGNIPRSRDLTSWLILIFNISILFIFSKNISFIIKNIINSTLKFDIYLLESEKYFCNIYLYIENSLFEIFLFLIIIMLIPYASTSIIGGFNFNKKLKFSFNSLNPLQGLKSIFSINSLVEFIKIITKISTILMISVLFIYFYFSDILRLSYNDILINLVNLKEIFFKYIFCTLISLLPFTILDVIYQIIQYIKKLKMSYKEIHEENKEIEGNAQIKSFIKQKQISQKKLLSINFKKSDVVISNPKHYAVALMYRKKEMIAPLVTAKGEGVLAISIKNKAKDRGIPILISPLLARILYKNCKVGKTIPIKFYSIIAEVLAWVYNLNKWNKVGGIKPKCPNIKISKLMLEKNQNV